MATVMSHQEPSHFQFPDSVDGDVDANVNVAVAPKTILQKTSKYIINNLKLKPALVSPENPRRQKLESVNPIPGVYVDTITKGFGPNADLYKDVLMVDPATVSDREIRIAYFRRGREVLAEGGVRGLDEAAAMNDVSNRTRSRFQAVSMAYEIVANPAWKEYYLQKGLVYYSRGGDDNCMAVDNTKDDPVSGSAASGPPKLAVRWKENVEELVFEREPEEAHPAHKSKKKKKRKNKVRVMVDTKQLDEHLEKLDKEAEQNFLPDFWDSLEESLDGLLKLATQEATAAPPVVVPKKTTTPDAASVSSADTDVTPFDELCEDAIVEIYSKQRNPTPTSDQAICDAGSTSTSSALTKESKSSSFLDCLISPPPTPEESKRKVDTPSPFRPISPEDRNVKATKSVQSTDNSDLFDLESIISGFSEVRNLFTAQKAQDVDYQGRVSPIKKELSVRSDKKELQSSVQSGEDDIFAGLDDADDNTRLATEKPRAIDLTPCHRSDSPTSGSLSDLSESVAVSTTHSRRSATSQTQNLEATREEFVDADASTASRRNRVDVLEDKFDDNCERVCDPESIVESLSFSPHREMVTPVSPESRTSKQPSYIEGEEDGFMEYLVAYITAIVHECSGLGAQLAEVEWDDTILGAFMVDDGEVDGMLNTLEREIKKTPTVDAIEAVRSFDAIEAVTSFG